MENSTVGTADTSATLPKASSNAPGITKRTTLNFVDAYAVMRRPGWNNRFDFGDTEKLADSLAANGMLTPIRVKRIAPVATNHEGKAPRGKAAEFLFELVDGDRRLTALEHLMQKGLYDAAFPHGVPAILVDKQQDSMTSLVQMFEANTGKPLLPLEEATAYKRMRDGFPEEGIKGLTLKQICARVGRRQVHVSEMLALYDAGADLKDAVASGDIGKTQAKKIAKAARGDEGKQKAMLSTAQKERSKGANKGTRKAGKALKIRALSDAQLSSLGAQVAEVLVTKVERIGLKSAKTPDLTQWVTKDDELIAAYTFGVLSGLRSAAGQEDVPLILGKAAPRRTTVSKEG